MSPAQSGIEALVELARRDRAEMRPVLLRVLSDLYVQERSHTPSEQARFAELACRLLDGVELPVRISISERLADCADLPPAVAVKLARDEFEAAAPILRRSPALDEAALHAILDQNWPLHTEAIAARAALPASVAKRLALKPSGAESETTPSKTAPQAAATAAETDAALTLVLARRYLAADSAERRTIAAALSICPAAGDEGRLRRIERSLREKLESAALRHRSGEFVALMHDRTGIGRETARRIVADPSGEALAVYCRAAGMPFSAASRILLFLNPGSGRSIEPVMKLAGFYDELAPAIARRLAAAWASLGGDLRPERSRWTRTLRERIERRPAAVRSVRGVTPARPAAASEI